MSVSDPLNSVYERAESLGRDVFLYVVTGSMFAVVSSVPWRSEIPWWWIREWNQFTLLFVAAIVTFSLGHGLLAIGFWIRNKIIDPCTSCDRFCNRVFVGLFCCQKHVDEYRCARKCVARRTQQALPGAVIVRSRGESTKDAHLSLEMSILLRQPRLHAVFIERYNTLWHLRLSLATAFLMAGVVNLAHVIYSLLAAICTRNECCQDVVILIVGSISMGIGCFLMRQHLTTNTNFLRRVMVAFNISKRTIA